jgi:REP element-mobilizing transposase RayT
MLFPQRKSPRLKDYDYTGDGAYFVTICTYRRKLFFGDVIGGHMEHNSLGNLARMRLLELSARWDGVLVDSHVVMPNHLHAIIMLTSSEKNMLEPQAGIHSSRVTLGRVIGLYKAGVTREAREKRWLPSDGLLWQGRYYDRIVRNEHELHMIRQYIDQNPQRWRDDNFYEAN